MHVTSHSIGTSSSVPTEELLDAVLSPLVALLYSGGFKCEEIDAAFKRAKTNAADVPLSRAKTNLGLQLRDCMEVMCVWRRETEFLDEDGSPALLHIGPGTGSFRSLCAIAGTRTEAHELLQTLTEFGAIRWHGDAHVSPATPTFIVGGARTGESPAVDGVLKLLAGYLRTINHNIGNKACDSWKPRFDRACLVSIPRELMPIFERTVADRGQDFIDSLDEWLERHLNDPSPSGVYVELGAGAYFIELGDSEPSRARSRKQKR